MANDIGLTQNFTTKKVDKVFKKRQQSSCLGGSKPKFRKKQNKL